MQEGLRTCDIMVVVISPASMISSNVEDEWSYFVDEKKPLIPVLWKPAEVHYQLRRIQYIDFYHQEYGVAFGQLCTELHSYGVQFNKASKSEQSESDHGSKLLWLVYDLLQLHRWLLDGMSKEWVDISLREWYRRAIEYSVNQHILQKIGRLIDKVRFYAEKDWTPEWRAQFANEIRITINLMAQEIQKTDPSFMLTTKARP